MIHMTRKEMRGRKTTEFKNGEIVAIGHYLIHIRRPPQKSLVEYATGGENLEVGQRPAYIEEFLRR